MFTPKVIINFSRLRDTELDQKAQKILHSVQGNANFPTPTPTITDLQQAIDLYTVALTKANDGTKQDTVVKNQMRDNLESLLSNLGLYIQLTSKGDVATMLSSGFDLSKPPTTVGVLDKPDGFKISVGVSKGSLNLKVKPITGAMSYQYEYTEAPLTDASVWKTITDTSTGITVSNLTSGKEYAFRVAGIGSDTTRVYSDVVFSFVL